jgi:hypothetical protein
MARYCEQATAVKRAVIAAIINQFGHPRGVAGSVAGWVMAHRSSNRRRNGWVVSLLEVQPTDTSRTGVRDIEALLQDAAMRRPGPRPST